MPDVFICSSPRSGSTVTRLTLQKLRQLITLPETHFWVFKKENRHLNFNQSLHQIAENWVNYYSIKIFPIEHNVLKKQIIEQAKKWNDILDITIKFYIQSNNLSSPEIKQLVCEKSPPHIFFLDQIKVDYPQAKFIFLVRDPRDVVASLKTCTWSTSDPVVNSLVWRNGVRKMFVDKNSMIIKYEDVVAKPEQTLQSICTFLEIDFDKANLKNETADLVESKIHTSTNSLKPIDEKFIGSYSKKLSAPDREQQMIEYICCKEMKQLGYIADAIKINRDFSLRIRILHHKIGILIKKIVG